MSANARAARISRTPAAALASFFPHRAFPAADAAASRIAPTAASSRVVGRSAPLRARVHSAASNGPTTSIHGPSISSTMEAASRAAASSNAASLRRRFDSETDVRSSRFRSPSSSSSRVRVLVPSTRRKRNAAHVRVSAGAPGSRRVTTSTSASAISSRASSVSASSPSAAARRPAARSSSTSACRDVTSAVSAAVAAAARFSPSPRSARTTANLRGFGRPIASVGRRSAADARAKMDRRVEEANRRESANSAVAGETIGGPASRDGEALETIASVLGDAEAFGDTEASVSEKSEAFVAAIERISVGSTSPDHSSSSARVAKSSPPVRSLGSGTDARSST